MSCTYDKTEGFRVSVPYNGLAAIEADAADPADFLLTDMRMPVTDGEASIRIIRQRRPDLPVVVIIGYSEHLPDQVPGRLVILCKPYAVPILIAMVKALLSSRTGATP